MTKNLDTIVEDIYALFDGTAQDHIRDDAIEGLGRRIATTIHNRLRENDSDRDRTTLRLSSIGGPCARKLWYAHHGYESENLTPSTRIKFLFGDILEDLLLFLAEASGHEVAGEQSTLEVAGVQGHRDALIDGVTVDVKSASTFSFAKFSDGLTDDNDAFGYLSQLGSYVRAGRTDDRVKHKGVGAFLVIDKQHGHICLDKHWVDEVAVEELVAHRKEVIQDDAIPERAFEPVEDGRSGNKKLAVNCSYCQYKDVCFDGVRTFLYSGGPRFLTEVGKEPKVPELIDGVVVPYVSEEKKDH